MAPAQVRSRPRLRPAPARDARAGYAPLYAAQALALRELCDDGGTGTRCIAFEVDPSDVAIAKIRRDFDLPEQGDIKLKPAASDKRTVHERASDLALSSASTASLQPQPSDVREISQQAMRTLVNAKLTKRPLPSCNALS